jgi:hypothetical protein
MTAEEYEPEFLTLEGLARIRATLPAHAELSAPVCDMAALIYLDGQAAVDNSTGRGIKADLRAMHREVLDCLNAVSRPRLEIVGLLGICGGAQAVPRFTELRKELAWLEETLSRTIDLHKRRHSKSHPWYLLCSLAILGSAYERATGKRATHSLHRDGQYLGEPLSPYGKFAVAVLAEIDPALPKRTIGSAIRNVFAEYRSEVHSFVTPDDEIRITPH